jgi:glycosyltransferase involved in cell wall biosynthesis
MPNKMTTTVIVVPCYNEAARLEVEAFRRFVALGTKLRFLFVNDGSTDETEAVLQRLCKTEPNYFSLHSLPQNRGKAEAVRQGVLQAMEQGVDLVGYWDADLAAPLDAIPKFLAFFEENPTVEIVLGARVRLLGRHIERQRLRHYLGRAFATVASLALDLAVYDTQCGAKLFRVNPATRRLFDEPFRTNWIFDVELLARFVRQRGATKQPAEEGLYELPLDKWRDIRGSRVKAWDFGKAVMELAVVYWTYLRSGAGG